MIKFAKPGGRGSPVSPRITVYGTLRCETAAYRPAVFTAKDDSSVGAVLGSGTPSGYYGGLHYLRLNQDQADSRVLEYFRMAYADIGIGALSNYQDEFTYLYRHAQFLNCRVAIDVHDSRTAAENVLISNTGQPFDVEDGDITAINCTIHNAYSMGFGYYTNCLFVDVTDTSAINEEDHNAITSGTGVFQTVQAGTHYLANSSPHRNQGTVNTYPELRSDLESMTTFPPDDRSDETISATTVWPVFAARDDDGLMDLGYHYPAVDYLVNSVTVDNARLLLDEGVAVAAYGSMGFDLSDQGQLISLGIWCVTNHICSYQAVQEQPLVLESATPPNMTIIASSVASSPGGLQARFTHFNGMADLGGIVDVDNVAVDLRNCAVYLGSLVCDTPFAPERVEIINNLFERAEVAFNAPSGIRPLDFFNNTAINSFLTFAANTDSVWHVKDNLFDHCTVVASPVNEGGVLSGNNAHRQGSISAGFSSAALSVDIEYATGPFGDRYIDPNYSELSSLVNAGSRLAFEAGMSAYTILPDDSQDVDTVDIGHHYHVQDLSGGTFWTDPSPLAEQMARAIMAGSGATVVPGSARYTGASAASGSFGGGSSVGLPPEFDRGVILSSGSIHIAAGPNDDEGGDNDTLYGRPGDDDLDQVLDALEPSIPGYPSETLDTEDAALLEFAVISMTGSLQFQHIFASEEYPEWLADLKNDAIAIIVGGENVAWAPNSSDAPVCVFTINQVSNTEYYRANPLTPNEVFQLQYDGFTSTQAHPWLTAGASVQIGAPVTVKIVIADEDDDWYDSAMFMRSSSLECD